MKEQQKMPTQTSMRNILSPICFLCAFIFFHFPAYAQPASSSCNQSSEVGQIRYNESSKDFYFCRNHVRGWESLDSIFSLLNAIIPLAGDNTANIDEQTNKFEAQDDMFTTNQQSSE